MGAARTMAAAGLLAMLVAGAATGAPPHSEATMNAVDRYIAGFQRGEGFSSPPGDLISQGRPDPTALNRLANALSTEDAPVREGIVDLLADLAIQTDPVVHQGAAAIRDPRIIGILAEQGMDRPDQGRSAAMDALRTSTPGALLAPYADRFAELLAERPSDTALLLVAKAKAMPARTTVADLAASPSWKDAEAVKIARAALGDGAAERALAAALGNAVDGEALASAAGPAGMAGTPGLLRLLGEQLRTPLEIEKPGVYVMSARLPVLDALRYNFPAEPSLYRNNVNSDEDYARAERFVTQQLGVRFTTPRPPYLKIMAFPTGITPRP
jgi:hypothetical protein